MNAKDTVGTAKKLGTEIIGDGKLAEDQAGGTSSVLGPVADVDSSPPRWPTRSGIPSSRAASLKDEERFATLLGHGALKVWSDLPREAQARLFTASVDDGIIANALAVFLHDHHPRTAHPPKPTRIA